ncbi:MAG: MmgE/PrpD family protein [Myxococcota bacterium]|jgi:2-methylcitrate dehydratase|nr:MmgE/PrpD family protein [Myxococcota bacterium]
MSTARKLSEFASRLSPDLIPQEVRHQTKRVLLDTLGCALGGYESEASRILLEHALECRHPEEATLIGSGRMTSAANATLVNGAMVRYLDYNDTAFIIQGETYRTGYHPSEVIPAVLALGERCRSSGLEVIAAINLGYDLSLAFLEGVRGKGMEKRGWNGDTRAAFIMPIVAGRLLGLTAEQMENAVGIAGSCHAVFGILDTPAEEYTMTKNIRFPTMAQAGIMAAQLAAKGFTGPTSIIEGHDGFVEVIMGGEYDLGKLVELEGKYSIRETCIKSIIADFSSHGHLTATLELAREHDLRFEDIAAIHITTSQRCAEHTGDPVKKYPKNKETADHSSYYLTAIAILDHEIGPAQFTPDKYADPRVKELIDKVELVGDPSLDRHRPAGISEITTVQGKRLSRRVDYPRGHARNPMTDEEITAKFESMAHQLMGRERMKKIEDTVFGLDKLADIGELSRLLVRG